MVASPADVELVLSLYPALAGWDKAALDALLDPDFVGEATPGLPLGLGGRYEGAQRARREFWGVIGRHFEIAAHPAETQVLPDGRILVRGTYLGSARETGRKLEAEFVHLVTVAGGRLTALVQLTDSARWAEALVPEVPAPTRGERPPLTALNVDLAGDVAEIRLQRPAAGNAIDLPMALDLLTATRAAATSERMRVLLLTADGLAFSPGGDLAMLSVAPQGDLPALLEEMLTDYHQALRELVALDVPIVAAVHGSAGGGSLGLLHVSDIVIAGTEAKFAVGSGFLALGSDGGNTWFLPRLVGRRVATQMCFQNRVLTAAEALDHGLVSEVVPTAEVAARAAEVAAGLARNSRRSNAKLRELLRADQERSLSDTLDGERRGMVSLASSPDVIEGMAAFLERRPATFLE